VIDTHLILKLVKRSGCHQSVCVARAACVIEQDIKPPQTAYGLADGLLYRCWLCDITQLECRVAARSDYTVCDCFALGRSTPRHHDASSLVRKHFGASLADPTRCSHHKSAFVS
jgi:hypothetical protein